MMLTVKEALKDLQRHHSILQLDSFITVKEGITLYGCLKQALRELNTRHVSLRDARFEIKKLEIKIKRWREKGDELSLVKADHMEEYLDSSVRDLQEIQTEHDRFFAQVVALRKELEKQGYKFPLSPEHKDLLDRDHWVHILKAQAAVEIMTGVTGRPSASFVQIFRALPTSMKKPLAIALTPSGKEELVEWFMNYEPKLPLLPAELERLQVRLAMN